MLTRACGCCDTETPEPRLVYATREGALVKHRLSHDCGKKWWRYEDLDGENVSVHVDR